MLVDGDQHANIVRFYTCFFQSEYNKSHQGRVVLFIVASIYGVNHKTWVMDGFTQ